MKCPSERTIHGICYQQYKNLTSVKLATNAVIIIEQGGFCMSFDAF